VPRVRRDGRRAGTSPVICSRVQRTRCDLGEPWTVRPVAAVSRCRGNGTVIEKPCKKCKGSGRERRTRRYTVKIPAGVKDGTADQG